MSFSTPKRYFLPIAAIFFAGVVCFGIERSLVLASDSCDKLEGDAQDQCEDLAAKAKAFKQIVDLKERQGQALNSQIETLDDQTKALSNQIDKSQQEINGLADQIVTLSDRITEKDTLVAKQKKVLGALLRSQYDNRTDVAFRMIVAPAQAAELNFFQADDYTSEAGNKTRELLTDIRSLREGLVKDRFELETKRGNALTLHQQLSEQNASLEDLKQNKAVLLQKTQADQQKYEDLLANVEAQKKELLDFSSASNIDELSKSVKDYPAPDKKNWASTDWYFSQKDSRWGNKRIGNSRSLMKDYGCAVTALSMVFRNYGSSVDPGKMLKEKIFSYDLIRWPSSWGGGIDLTSSFSHGNVSWSEIDSQIKHDHPVIVYIKKTNGRGGHYVVITGKDSKDYIVHDPFFGPNLYLKTSRTLVGKIGNDSGTAIDQMIIYEK